MRGGIHACFDVVRPEMRRAPERRIPGNLFGNEAAQLANDIGAKLVIPCHFEMFEFNTASPQKFIDECQRLMQPFKVLRCGEKWQSQNLVR
jgi:L-ascorbate metabolism protein UlaG (beta-lactamase superfamily)